MKERPQNLVPLRPEPVVTDVGPESVHKKSDVAAVAEKLLSGSFVRIQDAYPTGMKVMAELKHQVFGGRKGAGKKPGKNRADDFQTYRAQRTTFRHASNRLLVPVQDNRIALQKSPEIGWLKELYPDVSGFLLPFPQIQGLNSSWQWFLKGIRFPVLKHAVYPWYGTYFPTRFDHLFLFEEWLENYSGSRSHALDIGTGCGVLAFQLLKHGFEQVLATDINPGAIITVRENAKHQGVEGRLEARLSDLFEGCDRKADLMVFNPPWLPTDSEYETTVLDKAIYYEPDLFERFFSDAARFLDDDGRIVMFFSNLGRTEGMQKDHPIEQELAQNRRYKKVRVLRRKAAGPSRRTRRRDHRKEEYVELWELAVHH